MVIKLNQPEVNKHAKDKLLINGTKWHPK